MKKLSLLLVNLFVAAFSFAQNPALPNPGFENWTQVGNRFDPNSWNTLNPATAILGVYTATRVSGADAHSGSYAIKLQTKTVFFQVANGIASTGTIITTPPYGVIGGIPYTGRPDSIAGWFKYVPQGTDSGFVQFLLQDSTTLDTIGNVRWQTKNLVTGTYTRFSAPISYSSSAIPNLSNWILSSSRGSGPVVNSALYIDDLELIFNPIVCNTPTNLLTQNITNAGAKLKWNAVTGAINYQQKYRVVGSPTWIYKTSTNANKTLTGLVSMTSYEWAVRAKCSANPLVWSSWSTKKTFQTIGPVMVDHAKKPFVLDEENYNDLQLFPNPSSVMVNLSMITEQDELVKLTVYNAIGKMVLDKEIVTLDGTLETTINVAGFNKGIYLVSIDGNNFHSTKRLLVQ